MKKRNFALKSVITGVMGIFLTCNLFAQDPRLGRMQQSGSPATGQEGLIQSGGRNYPTYQTAAGTGGYSTAPGYPTGNPTAAATNRGTSGGGGGAVPISLIQESLVGKAFGDVPRMNELSRIAVIDANRVVAMGGAGSTVEVKAARFDALDYNQATQVRLFWDGGDRNNSLFVAVPMVVTLSISTQTGFYFDGTRPLGNEVVVRTLVYPRDNNIMGRADRDPNVFCIFPGGQKIMMPAGLVRFQLYLGSTEEQMLILDSTSLKHWSSQLQGTLSSMQRQ